MFTKTSSMVKSSCHQREVGTDRVLMYGNKLKWGVRSNTPRLFGGSFPPKTTEHRFLRRFSSEGNRKQPITHIKKEIRLFLACYFNLTRGNIAICGNTVDCSQEPMHVHRKRQTSTRASDHSLRVLSPIPNSSCRTDICMFPRTNLQSVLDKLRRSIIGYGTRGMAPIAQEQRSGALPRAIAVNELYLRLTLRPGIRINTFRTCPAVKERYSE